MSEAKGNAWDDLSKVIALVKDRPGTNPFSPFHCEHDTLTLCADPADFTDAEKAQLDVWGFFEAEDAFESFRYGSA